MGNYELDLDKFNELKEHFISHDSMLASHDDLHFYIILLVCLAVVIHEAIIPNVKWSWIQLLGVVAPASLLLISKYVALVYKKIFGEQELIYLLSSKEFNEIFRRILVLDVLIGVVLASVVLWRHVKEISFLVSVCMAEMLIVDFMKMWLYGLLTTSNPFTCIVSVMLDCPGTSVILFVSGFVQLIESLKGQKESEEEENSSSSN